MGGPLAFTRQVALAGQSLYQVSRFTRARAALKLHFQDFQKTPAALHRLDLRASNHIFSSSKLEATMRVRFALAWLGTGICGLTLVVMAIAGIARVSADGARVAMAQEENPDLPDDEGQAAGNAAAPAAGQGAGKASADQAGTPQSLLSFYFRALGAKYVIIFLAMSFTLVALVVMNILTLRRSSIVPLDLVEGFEAHLNEKRYQEAYDLAKSDDSFLGHVLSAGLGKLSAGYPQAIEAMQEVGEEETMKLEHRLGYIALIGTISPMIGLLGTVDGMVDAFRTIATSSTQPKPSALAEAISKALITTLVGLWLAIPAIAIFGIMRNRMARLTLEVGILSEGLMSRFSNVGKKG
jgi:biopolymer transport protein ExbB